MRSHEIVALLLAVAGVLLSLSGSAAGAAGLVCLWSEVAPGGLFQLAYLQIFPGAALMAIAGALLDGEDT